MKLVLTGGSGQAGQVLARAFAAEGHEVVVIGRATQPSAGGAGSTGRTIPWDARTLGDWAREIDGASVVVNLAGRSVNCRYTDENLRAMLASRVDSTRVVGEAIARAARPPRVWLQMSTATLYAHRFDAPNDEATGIVGGGEPGAPAYWANSVRIARAWEEALDAAPTPATRKVALRLSMLMSPDRGGIFDVMLGIVRRGLGGAAAGGAQYISWLHDRDFVRAVRFLIDRDDLRGAVNLTAPNPLPQRDFNRALREAWGIRLGLPAAKWMLHVGAWAMGSDPELALKSRRVVPGTLLASGFTFVFPEWPAAPRDHSARWREAGPAS